MDTTYSKKLRDELGNLGVVVRLALGEGQAAERVEREGSRVERRLDERKLGRDSLL